MQLYNYVNALRWRQKGPRMHNFLHNEKFSEEKKNVFWRTIFSSEHFDDEISCYGTFSKCQQNVSALDAYHKYPWEYCFEIIGSEKGWWFMCTLYALHLKITKNIKSMDIVRLRKMSQIKFVSLKYLLHFSWQKKKKPETKYDISESEKSLIIQFVIRNITFRCQLSATSAKVLSPIKCM